MKTFIFNLLDKIKQSAINLDLKVALTNTSWRVLNDQGKIETLIFQNDDTVVISIDGNAVICNYNIISSDYILIKHSDVEGTLLTPAYIDNNIFTLQKQGTDECMFLINDKSKLKEKLLSLDKIEGYFLKILNQPPSRPSDNLNQPPSRPSDISDDMRLWNIIFIFIIIFSSVLIFVLGFFK